MLYHPRQFSRKLTKQTSKIGEKPNFGPDFGLFGQHLDSALLLQFLLWILPLLVSRHYFKLSSYAV